jgi:hypothetical protein
VIRFRKEILLPWWTWDKKQGELFRAAVAQSVEEMAGRA